MIKKDKQKILGEFFDEARIAEFLQGVPPLNQSADFHLLERAYRGMQLENFETYLQMFVAEGRDINARNEQGKSLYDLVSQHQSFGDFAQALLNAGAQPENHA